MTSEDRINKVIDRVRDLLITKNRKYGDSAINPIRVMSSASPVEQILVRIDDKLNRIKQGAVLLDSDEDVVLDLIGYFVLLKVALDKDMDECYNVEDYQI